MSSAMFIHRTQHMEANAKELATLGHSALSQQVLGVCRRIKCGNIKTMVQLEAALDKIDFKAGRQQEQDDD